LFNLTAHELHELYYDRPTPQRVIDCGCLSGVINDDDDDDDDFSSAQEFRQKRVNVEFRDVSVTIGNKDILHSVYGAASAGQILAVLGPSGMTLYWLHYYYYYFIISKLIPR